MTYREVPGFVNVLYGIRIPHRDGKPLGGTEFSNMHLAYEDLPSEIKSRLAQMTATHNFEKFWEHMRRNHHSERPAMTDEQRRRRPPVIHPVFLTHPMPAGRCCTATRATRCASTNCPSVKAMRCWSFCSRTSCR